MFALFLNFWQQRPISCGLLNGLFGEGNVWDAFSSLACGLGRAVSMLNRASCRIAPRLTERPISQTTNVQDCGYDLGNICCLPFCHILSLLDFNSDWTNLPSNSFVSSQTIRFPIQLKRPPSAPKHLAQRFVYSSVGLCSTYNLPYFLNLGSPVLMAIGKNFSCSGWLLHKMYLCKCSRYSTTLGNLVQLVPVQLNCSA